MKSSDAIKNACTELKQRRQHAEFLKNRGLKELGQNVLTAVGTAEDVLRTAGFTVKYSEGEYTIKCKWSDAPEALKNGR